MCLRPNPNPTPLFNSECEVVDYNKLSIEIFELECEIFEALL